MIRLPHYKKHPMEIERGLRVPGEIGNVFLRRSTTLLICKDNLGSYELAEELKEFISDQNQSQFLNVADATSYFDMICKDDDHDVYAAKISQEQDKEFNDSYCEDVEYKPVNYVSEKVEHRRFLLVYLNESTFTNNCDLETSSELSNTIQQSCDDPDIEIILVHEQDNNKGACDFNTFYMNAPQFLINAPNNLFEELAIPLYTLKQYREVSLKLMLRKMGGGL